MNRVSKNFWHVMNKYHLNQTCQVLKYLFTYHQVTVGDYNFCVNKMNKLLYQFKHRDYWDKKYEMPGNIQIHHDYRCLKYFQKRNNMNSHNLYCFVYSQVCGYFTYHKLTDTDVKKLVPCLKEYARCHKILDIHDNLAHLSCDKKLPPYAFDDCFGTGLKYVYGDKGKPEKSSNGYQADKALKEGF